VWPAASSSVATNTQLFWEAGTTGQVPDALDDRSVPEGTTVTGSITFVPPPSSLASQWLSSAANVFAVSAPVGSVLDLDVQYTNSNVFGLAAATVVSGTLGSIYYLALDGPSSNSYVPRGLPTTS